jgi:rRNA small subunit pseudouridine methyltransferase Nep1
VIIIAGFRDEIVLILAESSLETVPKEIASHPSVRRWAARRGKSPLETLLDISIHYHSMRSLPNREKRGRPDIVHVSLLEALSSPLNLEGRLRVVVHTIGDYVLFVDSKTRIPRNYMRFVGLIEQAFKYGRVPPDSEKPLIEVVALSFPKLLQELGVDGIVLLDEHGVREKPETVCSKALEEGLPIVIGGFQRGDFSPVVKSYAKYTYSIYRKPLDTWVVVSRVLSGCERLLELL